MAQVGRWCAARDSRVALPVADGADAGVCRSIIKGTFRRLHYDCAARVRAGEVVAPSVPQSARTAHQGSSFIQAKYGRDERAVPSEALKAVVALTSQRRSWRQFVLALLAIIAATLVFLRWLDVTNSTIVALTYLLVVLLVAASSQLWVAVLTSCA